MRVDEIMKRREEEEVDADEVQDPAAEKDEEPPTPQLEEAIRILSDLVALSQQRAAARDASRPES